MAGRMKSTCMVLMAAVLLASTVPQGDALTCGSVTSYLGPCLNFLIKGGRIGGCCGGIRGLYGAARTPADRKTVCSCLKGLASGPYGRYAARASGLPGKCGVRIPYTISPSVNCATVN